MTKKKRIPEKEWLEKKEAERKRREKNQSIREILGSYFPNCFMGQGKNKIPLKIGIRADIIAHIPEISKTALKNAIEDYAQGPTYLRSMTVGATRIDLNGHPYGKVSQSEAEAAAKKLKKIEESIAKQKQRRANLKMSG